MAKFMKNGSEELMETPEYKSEKLANDVALRVAQIMKEKDITQKQLSKKLNISESYIDRILQGHNDITLLTLCKLAQILKAELIIGFEEKQ